MGGNKWIRQAPQIHENVVKLVLNVEKVTRPELHLISPVCKTPDHGGHHYNKDLPVIAW